MAVSLVLLTGKVLTLLGYDTLFLVFPLVHHCLLYTQERLVTEHLQYAGIYLVHV